MPKTIVNIDLMTMTQVRWGKKLLCSNYSELLKKDKIEDVQ